MHLMPSASSRLVVVCLVLAVVLLFVCLFLLGLAIDFVSDASDLFFFVCFCFVLFVCSFCWH